MSFILVEGGAARENEKGKSKPVNAKQKIIIFLKFILIILEYPVKETGEHARAVRFSNNSFPFN